MVSSLVNNISISGLWHDSLCGLDSGRKLIDLLKILISPFLQKQIDFFIK